MDDSKQENGQKGEEGEESQKKTKRQFFEKIFGSCFFPCIFKKITCCNDCNLNIRVMSK